MSDHLKKSKSRSVAMRTARQGFYERDIDAWNEKNLRNNNPFAKRLDIDTMELERKFEKEMKEVWE